MKYVQTQCQGVWQQLLRTLLPSLSPELVEVSVAYYPGWRDGSLAELLQDNLERDLERGMTVNGPHRADIVLRGGSKLAKDRFSRGEQKDPGGGA